MTNKTMPLCCCASPQSAPIRLPVSLLGRWSNSGNRGFSLLECLVIIAIVGILVAIAAPSWVRFNGTRQLNVGQDQVYQALRQTQVEAKQRRLVWQASFRNQGGRAQWAMHPAVADPATAIWHDLPPTIQIDPNETTIRLDHGIYEVQFNQWGHVNGQLGRVTLMRQGPSRVRRGVFVSTLIGAMRKSDADARR